MSDLLGGFRKAFTQPSVLAQREITETLVPKGIARAPGTAEIQAPVIGPGGEIIPGQTTPQQITLGSGGILQPPPEEQRTRTEQVLGAPPGIQALSDFLIGFGGGPQAALQQQQARFGRADRLLGAEQERTDRQAASQQRNFQRDVQILRLRQDIRRQNLNEAKFFAGLNQVGVDLGSPTEIATVSVLLRNGVDLGNQNSVLAGLSNARVLKEIGEATRSFGKEAQGTLAERIAGLRGFSPEKNRKEFADEIVKAKRELNPPGRTLGIRVPTKSVRDEQAVFIIDEVFGINEPSRARRGLTTLPDVKRFRRLKVDLSELIRMAGDEDTVRELLQAAQEALGPTATPEQLIDVVEREIELETKKKRLFRRRR